MKYQYLFTLLILSLYSSGQTKIFDQYDFEGGNFSLVLLNVELTEEDEIVVDISPGIQNEKKPIQIIDYRKHYILENSKELVKIKNSWEGRLVDYMHMCWYDYFIYLLEDGEVVSEMRANFKCKELLVDGVPYEFDSTQITSIFPVGKRIYQIEMTFDSIQSGRNFYNQVINNPDQLMTNYYRPKWIDYNGQFRVEYLDYEKTGSVEEKISAIINQSELKDYRLDWASSGMGHTNEPNDHTYRVFSNEQPKELPGLTIKENWKLLNQSFNVTFLKRNNPNFQ